MSKSAKNSTLASISLAILIFIFSIHTAYSQPVASNLAYAINGNATIQPPKMAPTLSCSNPASAATFRSNAVLNSQVCAYYVYVDSGVTLQTNGYSIYALTEFVNNGIVENLNGGSGGGSCGSGDFCGSSGNGDNGPDTSSLTSKVAGGSGGNSASNSFGRAGAGGAGAGNNSAGSSGQSGSNGGNWGGGGGGGACLGPCAASGGNGGGYIEIYANRFINNGVISTNGTNGNGNNWPGGGGGGGYIYLYITASIPSYVKLGNINANGGNGGSVSGGCGFGSAAGGAGGGGGGVVNISLESSIVNSGLVSEGTYSNSYSGSNYAINAEGGFGSSYSGCPSGTSGGSGKITINELSPTPTPSGCLGPGKNYTEKNGYCVFLNTTYITTKYPDALGGSLESSQGYTSSQPTTANQLSYDEQNAQWLLT